MSKIKLIRITLCAMAILATTAFYVLTSNTQSQADDSAAVSGMDEKALGDFIYSYIMDNPGIIIEAVEKYRANQEEEGQKLYERKLSENKDRIYHNKNTPSIGKKDADITIVEFFDYNCGYCKKALSDIQVLIKKDKNIRVVFVDMPILSGSSRMASLWALASDRQGKYWEYHVALMRHSGSKSESTLEKIAKDVGLDVEKMKKDVKDPVLETILNDNLALSRNLGIQGTPAFIINDTLARGYIGLNKMEETIKDIRSDKG